ncbi:MAG: peptidylprolyl isomerase [Rhizobacter sp.]|nr:peptidylprolyl isomerase [Chlorobiales bacterium]
MKVSVRLFAALFFIAVLAVNRSVSAQTFVEGIVAVVGDEVVLRSEVDRQAQAFAYNSQIDPRTPGLWRQVLDGLINQKILLAKAKLDSVQVDASQVDNNLTQRLAYYTQQLGSEAEVVKYFGKSIAQLRAELREDLKGEMMIGTLRQKKLGGLTVSNEEVIAFYTANKDSMPLVPAEVEIAHILIRPQADSLARASSLEKIRDIQKQLKDGGNFAELAKKYSDDPGSAQQGGDLGSSRRGSYVKPFEEAAFVLKEGETSEIVETVFGYHIIQLIERKGESIKVRHILVKFDKSKLNDAAAIEKLTEIRERIVSGQASFASQARLNSQDEATAQQGGDIIFPQTGSNRFPIEGLLAGFKETVDKLKPGEISEPVKVQLPNSDQYDYHIVSLKYRTEGHKMNLTDDYTRLKGLALQQRQAEMYEKWIASLRQEVYWKVKL